MTVSIHYGYGSRNKVTILNSSLHKYSLVMTAMIRFGVGLLFHIASIKRRVKGGALPPPLRVKGAKAPCKGLG